jgi:hypothetical protein
MVRLVLHGLRQPRMGLMLIGVLGLVVLAGWDRFDRSGRPWSVRYPAMRAANADRSTRGIWSDAAAAS